MDFDRVTKDQQNNWSHIIINFGEMQNYHSFRIIDSINEEYE